MKKGWSRRKLGDLCERITKGSSPNWQGIQYVEHPGVLFVTSENVRDGELFIGKPKYVEARFNSIEAKSILKNGDVLTNLVGASIGRTAVFDIDEVANINQAVGLLRCKPDLLFNRFVAYLLNSPNFTTTLHDNEVNNARANLSLAFFRNLEIPVPPLAEQQRIVGLLDEAFEGLATAKANAEKNLQNARALFESHLQSVFTQRGPGWVEATLSRATDGIFTGPFGSLLHKSDYVADGIPLVNPAHITEVGIEPDLRKTVSKATALRLKNYIMREGDIVIGRRGEMGRCALVTEVEDGWLCGTGSFFIKPSSRCDTRYLVRFLRSDSCKARLEKIAGGAVMPNLSNTDLGNLTFDLPPLERQKAIVEEIDSLHEETQRLARLYERKHAALEALKKSLLHQAFTGEL